MTLFKCFKCKMLLPTVRQYSLHFRRHHAIMVSRSYSSGFYCKQDTCDKHFLRFDSLIRHIKKWHVSDEICDSDIHSMNSDNYNISEKIEIHSKEEIHEFCENKDNINFQDSINFQESKEFDISKSAQKFIANLRMLSNFTGTAITAITNATQCLVSDVTDFIREEMHNFCKKQNINIESPDVQELLNKLNFDNLFEKMDTLQAQIKAVKNIYHYIDSVEIPLGFRLQQYFDRKEQMWTKKNL